MKTLKKLITTVVIALIIAVAVVLGYLGWTNRLSNEFLLPLLAILGVVCLLITLILAAILFAKLGIADKTQALALPEGSVRAVIALGLIVLFAIITIYLYSSLVNGELKRISVPTYEIAKAVSDSATRPDSNIEIVFIVPPLEEASTPNPNPNPNPTPAPTTSSSTGGPPPPTPPAPSPVPATPHPSGPFEIGYRSRASHDAAEFAKQLMTLLGTLVTSMTAFYFGARTVASAMESGTASNPSVTSVTPSEVSSIAGTPQGTVQVAIVGSGLNGTKSVKLSSTTEQPIEGTIVQKSDCAVVCTFANLKPGTWELVVTGDGESLRKPFKVT